MLGAPRLVESRSVIPGMVSSSERRVSYSGRARIPDHSLGVARRGPSPKQQSSGDEIEARGSSSRSPTSPTSPTSFQHRQSTRCTLGDDTCAS